MFKSHFVVCTRLRCCLPLSFITRVVHQERVSDKVCEQGGFIDVSKIPVQDRVLQRTVEWIPADSVEEPISQVMEKCLEVDKMSFWNVSL